MFKGHLTSKQISVYRRVNLNVNLLVNASCQCSKKKKKIHQKNQTLLYMGSEAFSFIQVFAIVRDSTVCPSTQVHTNVVNGKMAFI